MAVSGVRSSWLIRERYSLFACDACSATSRASTDLSGGELVGGDVPGDLDHGLGPPRVVALQGPPRGDMDAPPVLGGLDDLPVPATRRPEQREDRVLALGKLRPEQLARSRVRSPPRCSIRTAPAAPLFQNVISWVRHVPRRDRVVGEVEQLRVATHPLDEQHPVERRTERGAVLGEAQRLRRHRGAG